MYVKVRYADKTLKSDMDYHKQIEQAFVYRKSYLAKPIRKVSETETLSKFIYQVVEKSAGTEMILGGKRVTAFQLGDYEIIKHEQGFLDGLKEVWATGSILDGNSTGRFFRDYLDGRNATDGLGVLYKVSDIGDDGLGYRYITGPKKSTATKGKYFQGVPLEKRNLDKVENISPIENFFDLAGSFGNCWGEGGVGFRSGKKPEIYLKSILDTFSQEGDLVLDSFLGSGTTAAVAHKMNRRYIGIEMGDHALSHCLPRLQKVIDGEQGGISQAVNWQGGGGVKFYRLGEPIFDTQGQINPNIHFKDLAAHVWFSETKTPLQTVPDSPLLGIHNGIAYYLLYNGILGDKRPNMGNVLTRQVLRDLPPHDGQKVIYGESTRVGQETLDLKQITFKQTPYDIKAR